MYAQFGRELAGERSDALGIGTHGADRVYPRTRSIPADPEYAHGPGAGEAQLTEHRSPQID